MNLTNKLLQRMADGFRDSLRLWFGVIAVVVMSLVNFVSSFVHHSDTASRAEQTRHAQ